MDTQLGTNMDNRLCELIEILKVFEIDSLQDCRELVQG